MCTSVCDLQGNAWACVLKGKERNTFLQAMVMSHGEDNAAAEQLQTCQDRRGLAAQSQSGCVFSTLDFHSIRHMQFISSVL